MQILIPSLIVLFDFLLPCVLLLWLWKSRARSRCYLFSIVVLVGSYLVAVKISILGFWHAIGVFWPYLYFAVLVAVVWSKLRSGIPDAWFPKRWTKEFLLIGANLVHASAWVFLIVLVFQSHVVKENTLKLSAPLRNGKFWIIGGGANGSVNQHSRAVKYALDISQLNSIGLRASSIAMFPQELSKYTIFDAEVIAPCTGEVIGVENSVPNQMPLHPSSTGFGNFVAVFCQSHTVRLVHLRPGSVKVVVGEKVTAGQSIANVGNSGNTVEPHLHIDAVAGRNVIDPRSDGGLKSVPIEINGRFLVKGDVFSN